MNLPRSEAGRLSLESRRLCSLSAWDLGGWLVQAQAARGHATRLISKLNGLAISGSTANTVLHMAMQVSHSPHTGEKTISSANTAVIDRGP